MDSDTWGIKISGSWLSPVIAMIVTWLFGLALFALIHFTDNSPLAVQLLLAFSFPAVISYYGIKSAFAGGGQVCIDSSGFSIARGGNEERHAWADVECFYTDVFGAGGVYDGLPVPHFRLKDGTIGWLPNNLGLEAAQFVTLMERLRQLAERGWPYRPRSVLEVMRDDVGAFAQPNIVEPANRPEGSS